MKKTIVFLFLSGVFCLSAVGQVKKARIVSSFLHVDSDKLGKYEVEAFILKTPKKSSITWQSDRIKPLYQESDSKFLIKVDVPEEVLENVNELRCVGITKNKYRKWWLFGYKKEIEVPYGGVNFSVIKLEIKSNPQGAEVYLVPMRVWDRDFKDAVLEKSIADMEFYKVNTSVTDTFVRIDQTVFKIVFHVNDQFKTIVHRPQPQSIEPVQSVSVKF